ncbi:MAG: hypothetical protein NVSMB48_00440 [Marmoricola sp.]
MFQHPLAFILAWTRSRLGERNEDGFTAVEWMVIAVGIIAIAGIAILAVTTFVTNQGNKLNSSGG